MRTKRESWVGGGASGKPFQLIPKHLILEWGFFNHPFTVSPTLSLWLMLHSLLLSTCLLLMFVHESLAHYPEPNLYDRNGHKGPNKAGGFTHPTSQVSFLTWWAVASASFLSCFVKAVHSALLLLQPSMSGILHTLALSRVPHKRIKVELSRTLTCRRASWTFQLSLLELWQLKLAGHRPGRWGMSLRPSACKCVNDWM